MDISSLSSSSSSSSSEIVFSSDFDSTSVEFELMGGAAELLGLSPACCSVTVRKSRSGEFVAEAEKLGIRVTRREVLENDQLATFVVGTPRAPGFKIPEPPADL